MAETPARPSTSPEDWGVTPEEARSLLQRQVCPVCGEGPWMSPLNHVARKHGIDRHTMRDICLLTSTEVVADPELSEHFREMRAGFVPMAAHAAASQGRRKQRWTRAGIAKQASTIQAQNERPESAEWRSLAAVRSKSPEAQAKRSKTLREKWAGAPDEARQAVADRLRRTSDELSAQALTMWDRRGRQGCGTVASYKRGCRCDECRAAKAASRDKGSR